MTELRASGPGGRFGPANAPLHGSVARVCPATMSTAPEFWLWHSFREVRSGVSGGAVIMVFVIMLVVRS